ncbi:MAG: hypothetical protein KGI28_02510 [Thaumarchaeota archaeon]|nr:hypothetical protein [Nitrososphaerota archaeon]
MANELIDYVNYLIDSKKGDSGRLGYILSALQDGKSLYNSDKRYLDSLISTYLGSSKKKSGDQKSVEELKVELARVKERLEKFEKRGYKKPVGRKAVFFFVTSFFGWHAVITLLSAKSLLDIKDINPYLLPFYLLEKIIPTQYLDYVSQIGLSLPKIAVLSWGAMLMVWIILGFIYLVKFIRSRYNPGR